MDALQLSEFIKTKAREVGFSACGISKAEALEPEGERLDVWLKNERNADMQFMKNHLEKRKDPRVLVEGAKTVISVLANYYPKEELSNSKYKLAKYAYGVDYHFVVKEKLKHIVSALEEEIGSFNYRVFADSAPVMDKAWAIRSGLGFMGKNTNLIKKKAGSFFFIGEIICDLEINTDPSELKTYCGNCTRCLDACPTGALEAPYTLNANKCVSYLTIENRGEIPQQFKENLGLRMYGCDTCQDVCPHNRFSLATTIEEFHPSEELKAMTDDDWNELSRSKFKSLFKYSAVKRAGYKGLRRNIDFIKD